MKVLFAGPSLAGALAQSTLARHVVVNRGPVACGSVAAAVRDGATAIGLVDGNFEATLSVWHKEILYALACGLEVGGAASMGALRAAECAAFGMRGFGSVFEGYADGSLVSDADVAQIHAPAELDYVSLSEPMVNIAATLAKARTAGVLLAEETLRLETLARRTFYKSRTYQGLLAQADWLDAKRRAALAAWFAAEAVDQKRADALLLLDWLCGLPDRRRDAQALGWTLAETSHWHRLLANTGSDRQQHIPAEPQLR
jgi:hypothetical protein